MLPLRVEGLQVGQHARTRDVPSLSPPGICESSVPGYGLGNALKKVGAFLGYCGEAS